MSHPVDTPLSIFWTLRRNPSAPRTFVLSSLARHLGPIDLEKGHCTTFLGAADFFWVLVHGLSGTRRAQTFFPVHCEPKATPGKTHERHRRSPGPRTFSHLFNLILKGIYFYGWQMDAELVEECHIKYPKPSCLNVGHPRHDAPQAASARRRPQPPDHPQAGRTSNTHALVRWVGGRRAQNRMARGQQSRLPLC